LRPCVLAHLEHRARRKALLAWKLRGGSCRHPRDFLYDPPGRQPRIEGATTAGGCMQTVIILIHLMIVLAMIGVVLLQKSEGGGLGIGSTGGFFCSRGGGHVGHAAPPAVGAALFAPHRPLYV